MQASKTKWCILAGIIDIAIEASCRAALSWSLFETSNYIVYTPNVWFKTAN